MLSKRASTIHPKRTSVLRLSGVIAVFAGGALIATVAAPASATPSITATGTGTYLVQSTASPLGGINLDYPFGVALSPDSKTVYVSEQVGNEVKAITVATDAETDIPLAGVQPQALVVSPDGDYVYVADELTSLVEEIQTSTDTVVASYSTVSSAPVGLALSSTGSDLFIAEQGDGGVVEEVTAPGLQPVATVSTSPGTLAAMLLAPDGQTLWIAGSVGGLDGWVQPIAASSLSLGASTTIGADSNPSALAISPDGSTLYVADAGTDTVQSIATATGAVGTPADMGGHTPTSLAVSPDGNELWVGIFGDGLYGFPTSDLTQDPAIYTGDVRTAYGLAVSPDGNYLYAPDWVDGQLTIMNAVHVTVSGPGQISAGTPTATFQLSIADGNTPVGDFSHDLDGVQIVDSQDNTLATSSAGSPDAATGTATAVVPTAQLKIGSYRVEGGVGQSPIVGARSDVFAGPFVVTGSLASTGTDAGTPLAVGALLVMLGGIALALPRRRSRAAANMPQQ